MHSGIATYRWPPDSRASRSTRRWSSTRTSSSPAERPTATATPTPPPTSGVCSTIQASMQSAWHCPIACTPRCYRRYCARTSMFSPRSRSGETPPRPLNSLHLPGSPARSPVLGSRSGAYPGLAAVHDLLAANAIGEVHSFTAWYNADYAASADAPFSWRYAKETAGAGALIDIGTHAIDAVQHVIAPVRGIISSTLRTVIDRRPIPGSSEFGIVDTDDIALLTVELTNGAVGQIHVNRVASGVPNSLGLEIHGSHGHARFDSISAGEFYLHTDDGPASLAGPRRVFTGPQHPYFTDVAAMPGGGVGTGYAEAFVAEIQHFVRCIISNTPMDTSFPSAYRVMLVVDAAQQSAATGTSVVSTTSPWPTPDT